MSQLTVSLLQTPLHWEDKAANLQHFSQLLSQLPAGTQLAVLPEMFTTGFSMQPQQLAEPADGPTVQWMRQQAQQHRIIVAGSIIAEEAGHYFNRLLWVLPNGQVAGYNKRHLFGYAGEDAHYQSGTSRVIVSVNGFRVLLQVCYDLRFPVWARQQPQPDGAAEYDVLLYVANWPDRRIQAWRTLLQARAIENQCYVVAVNRTGHDGNGIYHSGHSMVVSPLGEILLELSGETAPGHFTLQRSLLEEVRQQLPFLKDRDTFFLQ
ncbi:MAG: amidohydrolase [Chitinophagaceae bacterium]|nr:amidohydrolase [Chitinophagaceae bacterium]